MRLLKPGSIGFLVVFALACSPTSTRNQTPIAAESSFAAAPLPDAAASNPTRVPQLRAGTPAAAQWTPTNWSAGNSFFDLYASQDRAFARIWDSLNGGRTLLTADGGTSWTQIGSADTDMDIVSIVALTGGLLSGTWNGLYQSTSGGASWTALTPAGLPADTAIWSLAKLGTTLFAGTIGHVYKSADDGATWTEISSGIATSAIVTSFVASGIAILAGSNADGVFRTTNGGTSWAAANSGLADTRVAALAVMGSRSFAVTSSGVFVSSNDGTSWTADGSGLSGVNCFLALSDQLLAGTDNGGVYSSTDSGVTWTAFNNGLPAGARVWSLAATSNNVFAGTDSGIWRSPLVPNSPPTVVTPAAASPNPVTGTTTGLSVLGGDDGGEAGLTYTWAASGTPPAPVSFSANGTNAAKNTTATFTKAGSYTLLVTVRDQPGLTTGSQVTISVDQTLTSIAVSPPSATVAPLLTQQFVATALDQFATAFAAQPAFTWTVSGGGSIDASGLFTAGADVGGPYTVTAQSGTLGGAATVTTQSPPGCQCNGTGPNGPVTASCGQSACGSNFLTYSCSAAGWALTGQACSGNNDASSGPCQCTGTGPGNTPVTVNCGQSACGSNFVTYSCGSDGWSLTGQACSGNSDAGGGPCQ